MPPFVRPFSDCSEKGQLIRNCLYINFHLIRRYTMKYSDAVKAMLLASIRELASNPEEYAVNPGKDFSRNRKLGFDDLLLMLLTMEAKCLKEEIYLYFGRETDAPSKAAFYKQRKKLKDGALRSLLISFTRKCKKKFFKGKYSLVACDGSAVDYFRDPEDPDTYFESNGKSKKGYNQIHINALFSILDRKFTDLVIQPARKRNEYSAFCQMVDRSAADNPTIYLCDRGYASYNNFAHVVEKGQSFLIRCTDKKAAGLLGLPLDDTRKLRELDCQVERILSRSQSRKKHLHPELEGQYRYICSKVPMDYITESQAEYTISLRVVRVELAEGCYENLITNLPAEEFNADDLKALYHLRWDEETSYRDLKYAVCLKAFHSKKYAYIVQEVWARAILYNFCSEIASHVEIPEQDTKFTYQINYSEAVKICRDFLRIHDGTTTLNVESLIAQNVEAVRPNRTFPRQERYKRPFSFLHRN